MHLYYSPNVDERNSVNSLSNANEYKPNDSLMLGDAHPDGGMTKENTCSVRTIFGCHF